MVDAPLAVIFEIIVAVIQGAVSTLFSIFRLMADLFQSLSFVGSTGGLGFFLAVIVMAVVLFFVGKFILKSGKMIIILFIIGILLLLALFSAI
jgi:hypothetical protein